MGRYIRVSDLASPLGWQALAEAAAPDDPDVDGAALQEDPPSPAASAALASLEQQIGAAEGVVDSLLLAAEPEYRDPARGADDPLSPVGARTLDIALDRVFGPGAEGERRARAQEALEWLKGVAAGEIALSDVDGDGEVDEDAGAGGILVSEETPVFTPATLSDYTSSPSGGA